MRLHLAALFAVSCAGLGAVAAALAGDPPLLAAKIEFEKAGGEEAFRLDPEGLDAELQLPKEKRIATYRRDGGKLRFDLPKGAAGGVVEASAARDRYTLRGEDGKKVERILAQEPDGDWKLLDAEEKVIFEIKLRDDGFKVVDAKDTEIGRVKVKEGKTSLRDGAGKELLETKDPIPAIGAAAFLLDGLTLPQKGAMAMAVITWPPKIVKVTPAGSG